MKHSRADYARIQDPEHKIPEDEPVFLLRGQDKLAPSTVRFWAKEADLSGVNYEMVEAARSQANAMLSWQTSPAHLGKLPDLPIDTFNMFMVGVQGDNIIISVPPTTELTKNEALTMAAWLVALATTDPEKDFEPILNAVIDT